MDHRVSPHALDRYREHHPEAEEADLMAALAASEPVIQKLARAMLARGPDSGNKADEYFLVPDRRGFIVVDCSRRDRFVVTYLRFGGKQEAFAREHWPSASARPPQVPSIPKKPGVVVPQLGVEVSLVQIAPETVTKMGGNSRAALLNPTMRWEDDGGGGWVVWHQDGGPFATVKRNQDGAWVMEYPIGQVVARRRASVEGKPRDQIARRFDVPCLLCQDLPTAGRTGLCGPCCFGDPATAGGRW